MTRSISLPLTVKVAQELSVGDEVLLSGEVLTGRDQACRRLFELLEKGKPLPVSLAGQLIYFVGPTPAAPGRVVGSAGPTTASRMNPFLPKLLNSGISGFIGKGYIGDTVKSALVSNSGLYFGAIGGTGALLSQCIVACEVVAFHELLSEAIHRMKFRDFPVVVLYDTKGQDLYDQAAKKI